LPYLADDRDDRQVVVKDVTSLPGYVNINDAPQRYCKGVAKHDLPVRVAPRAFQ